jgi:hypothetical protein
LVPFRFALRVALRSSPKTVVSRAVISAGSIALDLNGHTIDGVGTAGRFLSGDEDCDVGMLNPFLAMTG